MHAALLRAAGEGAGERPGASGPVLLLTDQSAQEEGSARGFDGVVVLRRPVAEGAGWTAELQMAYGGSTTIRAAELPSALDRLRQIHLVTTV
ncbi:hypothetical protein BCY76_017055 [Nesterenkonia sp. PF2B19]|nr:hypothetical protein BCY76_017055 [Nesterenkonia sp. PF2B19]